VKKYIIDVNKWLLELSDVKCLEQLVIICATSTLLLFVEHCFRNFIIIDICKVALMAEEMIECCITPSITAVVCLV